TEPTVVRAQLRSVPALTLATTPGICTRTGVVLLAKLPLPSSPRSPAPQQNATPSERTAQLCVAPELTCAQGSDAGTLTGAEPVIAALPSCPAAFEPQQYSS